MTKKKETRQDKDTMTIDVPIYRIKYRFRLPWVYWKSRIPRFYCREFTIYDKTKILSTHHVKFTFNASEVSPGEVMIAPDATESLENLKSVFEND